MKRPFVTANFAITADGRISTRAHTPADFSSPRDKRRLLEIRAECDAVLVGAHTVANDRMTMGLPDADLRAQRRAARRTEYPLRVLISNSGNISPSLRVFEAIFSPILIFTTRRMPSDTREALTQNTTLHITHGCTVDLPAMFQALREQYGVRRLVCEGGAALLRSLLIADLIDELHVTVTPHLFGGKAAPTLTGPAGKFLPHSTHLRIRECRVREQECFLRYAVSR